MQFGLLHYWSYIIYAKIVLNHKGLAEYMTEWGGVDFSFVFNVINSGAKAALILREGMQGFLHISYRYEVNI